MSKVYEKADDSVRAIMRDALSRYHPELHALGPKIGITMVTPNKDESGAPTAPAISVLGAAANAKIKRVSPKDRTQNDLDLEILIDAERWEELTESERLALMDHELTHVEIVRDSDGVPKTGDDTRPMLKMRPDELVFTGFAEVIERHGAAALEYQAITAINTKYGQQFFDWAEKTDTGRKSNKSTRGLRAAI